MDNYFIGSELNDLIRNLILPINGKPGFDNELISGFRYTLRVGNFAYYPRTRDGGEKSIQITNAKPFQLLSDREVVIKSLELFNLIPEGVFGEFTLNSDLAKRGLVLVAPNNFFSGTSGYPHFIISNLTYTKTTMRLGDPFIDVMFQHMPKGEIIRKDSPFWSIEKPNLSMLVNPEKLGDSFPAVEGDVDILMDNYRKVVDKISIIENQGYFLPQNPQTELPAISSAEKYDLKPGQNYIPIEPSNENNDKKLVNEAFTLKAGSTTILETDIRFKLDHNVNGFIMPSKFLMKNYILLQTDSIQYGFSGLLELQLYNYGIDDITITKDEIIASAFLKQVGLDNKSATKADTPKTVDFLGYPSPGKGIYYSPAEISSVIRSFENKLIEYKENYQSDRKIIDLFFMAAIAGIIAGIILAVLSSLLSSTSSIKEIVTPRNGAVFIALVVLITLGVRKLLETTRKK